MLKDYKNHKDDIMKVLERDAQLEKIEVATELNDDLKRQSAVRRAINALKEYEQSLDIKLSEREEAIVSQYTVSENLIHLLPKYLTVTEVGKLLSISPQMVRRKCMANEIEAHRTLNGKGKWRIPSSQFVSHPDLEELLLELQEQRRLSERLASVLLQDVEEVKE